MTVPRSRCFLITVFGCLLLVSPGDMRLRCHYGESAGNETIIRDRLVTCSTALSKYCFKLEIPISASKGNQAMEEFRGCNNDPKHGRMTNSTDFVDECTKDGCMDYPRKGTLCCCSESKCNE